MVSSISHNRALNKLHRAATTTSGETDTLKLVKFKTAHSLRAIESVQEQQIDASKIEPKTPKLLKKKRIDKQTCDVTYGNFSETEVRQELSCFEFDCAAGTMNIVPKSVRLSRNKTTINCQDNIKTSIKSQINRIKSTKTTTNPLAAADLNRKSTSPFNSKHVNVNIVRHKSKLASNSNIIYPLFSTSLLLLLISISWLESAKTTNFYWPLRKSHQSASSGSQPDPNSSDDSLGSIHSLPAPLKRHQLLIGQQYSNFSSIIPYSIVQDSDYGLLPEVGGQLIDADGSGIQQPQQQQPFEADSVSAVPQLDPLEQKARILIEPQVTPISTNAFNGAQIEASLVSAPFEQEVKLINAGQHTDKWPASSLDTRLIIKKQDEPEQAEVSRSLLSLGDSNRLKLLPQMQQIKSRFNQGCVGGTKCQFFAFCWMSGGSLGASCGLLMTCCITPSRHEIQPGFYGPVVNDPYCGRSTSKINRIVGGTDASFGQFPWQAFVQVGGSRCGGALISSRHVVTAGHCVARSQHSPSSIKVTLGDYILNSDIESIPHEVFTVVEVYLHPNFRFTPQADRYDVAVLELDRQASYKDNIKPICLPQKDAIFVGRVAYVAGWGALQAGSKLRPKVLQHVAVPVIENHVCESWHRRKGIDIRIYDEMMCAGYELGQRDACQGDSGGPLMLNQFGVWYLVGIVSAGYSCAKQYQPGIYHRLEATKHKTRLLILATKTGFKPSYRDEEDDISIQMLEPAGQQQPASASESASTSQPPENPTGQITQAFTLTISDSWSGITSLLASDPLGFIRAKQTDTK